MLVLDDPASMAPAERLAEVAALLAAGILRLSARPQTTPEPPSFGAANAPGNRSDSAQGPLDSWAGYPCWSTGYENPPAHEATESRPEKGEPARS